MKPRKNRLVQQSDFEFQALEPRKVLASFLVNFANDSPNVEPVVASDFLVANPGINLNAPVNQFNTSSTNLLGSDGVSLDVEIENSGGQSFATTSGNFPDQPILDSYLFTNSSTDFRTVTVSGLDQFASGSFVTLALHGVGDQTNQDTEFQVNYNGTSLGLQETDHDSLVLEDTFVLFSFSTVSGADSVELEFRNAGNGGQSGAFGGFSLTAVEQQAIRINAGGQQHIDAQGNLFLADQFSSGAGGSFSTDQDVFIVGTGTNVNNDSDVDDILYQTERFGSNVTYEIPVADGIYDLRLHFAEIFFDEENQRVFDVTVEGQTILDDLDIFGTRMNAFTPGDFASLVFDFSELDISDGFLTLNINSQGDDGINNAKISAIEVLPVNQPSVVLLPTGGSNIVSETGLTDTFDVVLSQAPTSDVTIQVVTGVELSANTTSLTFTAANFDVPQTVTLAAIQDSDAEGQQTVPIQLLATSNDAAYDGLTRSLNITVLDDDLVPVEFDVRTLVNINNPIAGAFGPDGRLYVADQGGLIRAFTFDNDNNIIDTEEITTITDLPDSGNVLGIAFNPFEEVAPGETATLFVSQSFLFRATTEFENNVLALSGPNHSVITEVITGLPVSGFDHGINGIQFDGEGNLLVAVGGNTNVGVFDQVFGSDAPESPLTSAILRARISDPNFNGNIQYEFIDPTDPDLLDLADALGIAPDPNNQLFGEFLQVVDVAGEVEVETFAVGLRNPFDLVFTTEGLVFATDNGPNGIAMDELNLVSEGDFLGHPSIPRGRLDPRQALENAEFDPNAPSTDDLTSPLTALPSSTNGIDEFRSEVFGGQLRGQLFAQDFNQSVFFFELDEAGTGLANLNTFEPSEIANGLDILAGPGGVIFGIDRNQDRITIAEPVDNSVVTSTAFDIFPFRAPAVGGNQFVIGGANFGSLADTTVLVDGFEAELISVESNRIVGVFPTVPASTILRDVTVISDQEVSILEGSFLPLGEGLETVVGRNVFYNDSAFDNNDAGASSDDDNAIATDKVALRPGETATFENYTSFVHGINGIIIDAHLNDAAAFTVDDVLLSSGIGNSLSDFEPLGIDAEITVRVGEGVDGSDRITIILPNGSVVNEYLQVRVLANDTTGLSQDDVFYFGNIVGDTGNSTVDTVVDVLDTGGVRENLSVFSFEGIENPYDFNRDMLVDILDEGVINENLTVFFAVPLITAPSETSAALIAPLAAQSFEAASQDLTAIPEESQSAIVAESFFATVEAPVDDAESELSDLEAAAIAPANSVEAAPIAESPEQQDETLAVADELSETDLVGEASTDAAASQSVVSELSDQAEVIQTTELSVESFATDVDASVEVVAEAESTNTVEAVSPVEEPAEISAADPESLEETSNVEVFVSSSHVSAVGGFEELANVELSSSIDFLIDEDPVSETAATSELLSVLPTGPVFLSPEHSISVISNDFQQAIREPVDYDGEGDLVGLPNQDQPKNSDSLSLYNEQGQSITDDFEGIDEFFASDFDSDLNTLGKTINE